VTVPISVYYSRVFGRPPDGFVHEGERLLIAVKDVFSMDLLKDAVGSFELLKCRAVFMINITYYYIFKVKLSDQRSIKGKVDIQTTP